MLENDDNLEENNQPDLTPEGDIEPEVVNNEEETQEPIENLEQNSEMSIDDIFADIPPMPEGYEESMDAGQTYEIPNEDTFENFDNNNNFSAEDETVTVQPVKFASFDDAKSASGDASKNLDNLLDIKLQLTVELGRTTLPVKKVLELTRGSIIELDKIAGEPVELYANGKLIAHGEVVVIEDNFGLRVTSMTEPENRLNGLQ